MNDSLATTSRPAPDSDAERNALFYVPVNPFVYKQPAVPCHSFEEERLALLADPSTTRTIALDLGDRMGLPYLATTPNMLARYVVLGRCSSLMLQLNAVACIYYVMTGRGVSEKSGREIRWQAGDVFMFPGGERTMHTAGSEDAALYLVTDEPLLSFAGTKPACEAPARIGLTHFPAPEIELNLARACGRQGDAAEAAKAVWLLCTETESLRTSSPNLSVNLNTLEPGADQRPHRHNAAAITLSIAGEGVHSMVSGARAEWRHFGVMVTPPGALHSHHNRGTRMMRSFVAQDSGLHYYARTTGFRFDH